MVTFKIGGKNGRTIKLTESDDLVVVRTKNKRPLHQLELDSHARSLSQQLVIVASFPEADVSVYRCANRGNKSRLQLRNQVRKVFSKHEEIHFAGRVLVDDAGMMNLYTENLFIKFIDELSPKECLDIIKKYELVVKKKVKYATNAYFLKAKEGTGMKVFDVASSLLHDKRTEYCHPELIKQKKFKTIHPNQWHLNTSVFNGRSINEHVDVSGAWEHTQGEGIVIAIIDDGVDINHIEFSGSDKIIAPRDLMLETDDPNPKFDDDIHGTPCAGVACANGKDKASGVAPEAVLMPLRLRAGLGSMKEAEAFEWAADHGADIISCSWGPADGPWWDPDHPRHTITQHLPDSTRLAIEYAATRGRGGKGCIITWAAGNGRESTSFDGYASSPNVLAIAACNDTGQRSVYSDFGPEVFCCFPSNDFGYSLFHHPEPKTPGIWTTDIRGEGGYHQGGVFTNHDSGDAAGNYVASFGGTSSACPGVAGIIALALSINPELSTTEVKSILKASCDRIDQSGGGYDGSGHSIYYGYGRLNATKTVMKALKTLETEPDVSLNGTVVFKEDGEKILGNGLSTMSSIDGDKILGLSLEIDPPIPGLDIAYNLRFNKIGNIELGKNGQLVLMQDRRRKSIGFTVQLLGSKAPKYSLNYSLRTKDGESFSGSNGSFCGPNSNTGSAIEELEVSLHKLT